MENLGMAVAQITARPKYLERRTERQARLPQVGFIPEDSLFH